MGLRLRVYLSPCCRADYLDRGLTPHLLAISKKGLRAKWMKPIFPVSVPPLLTSDRSINISIVPDFPVSLQLPTSTTITH